MLLIVSGTVVGTNAVFMTEAMGWPSARAGAKVHWATLFLMSGRSAWTLVEFVSSVIYCGAPEASIAMDPRRIFSFFVREFHWAVQKWDCWS